MKRLTEDILIGAGVGFLAGLAVAVGGAIKDSPNEGFKILTFIRSPIVGLVEGAILQPVFRANPVLTFFGTIGTERLTVESYKLLRAQVPVKFVYGEWGRKF